MRIRVIKRRSVAEAVAVKRELSTEQLIEENDRLLREIDNQFNNIIAEIRIVNRLLADKLAREED